MAGKVKIIAEIGCNHLGDIKVAKEMIKIAKIFCDADTVKFQKRYPKELLTPEEYHSPHPVPYHSYGKTYGEHREKLEFSLRQHRLLKKYCESLHIEYSTSVWDLTSAREIVSLKPKTIKIPSACNLNFQLLDYLANYYPGDIHISTGMTTHAEIDKIVQFMVAAGRGKDTVLYCCTSGYPVKFEATCLLEITRLKEQYAKKIKGIGLSGHHLGIAIDIAAVTLGINYLERHFTLDRTWKGTDHSASLESDGLKKLARDVKATLSSLQYKHPEILPVEEVQRQKLKKHQLIDK